MSPDIASVSVVIPCFQCTNTIQRAIESVARQTQKPIEVILVDDASGDDTLSILYAISKQYSGWIKVITLNKNQGAANARNVGWSVATQPYIAFLDADDAWHPQKIEIQYNWMLSHPEYGLSGHGYLIFDHHSNQWRVLTDFKTEKKIKKLHSLLSNPFATRTVMLKRDLPFKFKQGKRYIEDYLLWLEIILADIPAAFINKPLAASYKDDYGSSGLSANLWKMEKGELDTYFQIYKYNKIGLLLMALLSLCSLLKYIKRVFVVATRTWIKKI